MHSRPVSVFIAFDDGQDQVFLEGVLGGEGKGKKRDHCYLTLGGQIPDLLMYLVSGKGLGR